MYFTHMQKEAEGGRGRGAGRGVAGGRGKGELAGGELRKRKLGGGVGGETKGIKWKKKKVRKKTDSTRD